MQKITIIVALTLVTLSLYGKNYFAGLSRDFKLTIAKEDNNGDPLKYPVWASWKLYQSRRSQNILIGNNKIPLLTNHDIEDVLLSAGFTLMTDHSVCPDSDADHGKRLLRAVASVLLANKINTATDRLMIKTGLDKKIAEDSFTYTFLRFFGYNISTFVSNSLITTATGRSEQERQVPF